ncbi:MAG: cupin domain-containing protein [Anaerolineae bacterium]
MFRKQDPSTARELLPGIVIEPLAWGERTSMAKFRLSKGTALPLHSHPHEQTGYMVSGHGIFLIGGKEIDAVPGDSWSIPGDVEHSVEVLEDTVIVEVFSPVREEYLPE